MYEADGYGIWFIKCLHQNDHDLMSQSIQNADFFIRAIIYYFFFCQ